MMERERSAPLNPTNPPPFRVEDCLVLPSLNRIECGQEVHQIEPRVMQVLVCLASRPNEVLSRQELFDVIWVDSVVCEEALTRTISELRRVFRDDTKTPRVIETIRKGGYRLIAPVTPVVAPAAPAATAPAPDTTALDPVAPASAPAVPESAPSPRTAEPLAPESAPFTPESEAPTPASASQPSRPPQEEPESPPVRRRIRTRVLTGIVSLLVVAILPLSIWGVGRFSRSAHSILELTESRPLTSSPGLEIFPALSPDGSMVAFSWAGAAPGGDGPLDIYVMKVRNGSPVRLTNLPGSEFTPSWSPDGTEIAFASEAEDGHEICTVPVLGGSVRRLVNVKSQITGLDWSPDGRTIAYASADTSSAIPRLHLLSLESLSRRDLTSPPQHCQGELDPAFSPDGRSVAFIRVNELQEQDAYFVPVEGGAARKVDLGGMRVSGVDWLSPREMIISAASKIDYGLWRVAVDTGERTRLSDLQGRIQRVATAGSGRQIAYEQISFARDISCLDISKAGTFHRRPEPLIASTRRDAEPVFSPDGRSIAFVSDRSGSPEIWIADAGGGNPRQLTDHQATQMTHPRWSPDGAQIAYSCNAGGPLSLYVTQIASRIARRVLPGGPQLLSAWSRQGNDLYYQVDAAGGWEVWRVHPDGSGSRRISEAGSTIIGETPDGRGLLCLKSGEPGIWRLPVDGGERSLVVPGELCQGWEETIAAGDGLYYLRRGNNTSTLGFYDLAASHSDSLASLEWYAASLALSPDRSMLLYDCTGKIEVDVMLAEVRK